MTYYRMGSTIKIIFSIQLKVRLIQYFYPHVQTLVVDAIIPCIDNIRISLSAILLNNNFRVGNTILVILYRFIKLRPFVCF